MRKPEEGVGQVDMSATELAGRLGTEDAPFVLDVREPDEVAEWAIPGAVNIPLGEVGHRTAEVPGDRAVVAVCGSGSRSAIAADMLRPSGHSVVNLIGGMAAWAGVYDQVVVDLDRVRIVQVRRRAKGCLSYLVGSGGEAFVFDPSDDLDVYLESARSHGWRITRVFDTHLHADHLSGAPELAETVGASLHLNPADAFEFPFEPLADGDRFVLPGGAAVSVGAIHTPGHTEGSTIYVVDDQAVVTGDTLFVEGVGRPDLAERAEEFAHNLHRSLSERVLGLPFDTLVLPSHHGDEVVVRPDEPVAAGLGELRQRLAPLQLDEQGFVAWAVARTTPRPPHYVQIVKANMGRAESPRSVLEGLEAGPNRCAA